MNDPTFQMHPDVRPAPQPPERLSDPVKLDLAVQILLRARDGIAHGIYAQGRQNKPRRLSVHDRDAKLLAEIDAALVELRR